MKVLALISGGKDSTYNMMQCVVAGHDIVGLANLFPISKNELDSYMYQSVGFEAIDLIASAMDLPIFRKETMGKSSQQGKIYVETKDDEVEDLFDLLNNAKQKVYFEGVSVGAILSDYQRVRVENVCNRLGLVSLAYLWQRNQKELLDEMINCEVDAVLIKVASLGLEPKKHLGRSLSSMQSHLHSMHDKYGLHICGEGGEYETLTLDCPLFKSRIVIMESQLVIHSDDPIAPVGYLKLNKLQLERKLPILNLHERLQGLPLKDCDGYVTDQGEDCQDLNNDELDSYSLREPTIKFEDYAVDKSLAKQNYSVQVTSSGWLWIGGITGDKSDNPMAAAMTNLSSCLSSYNHNLSDVCSISMYINNMKAFEEMNKYYVSYFNFPNPPTRACVEVPLHGECPLILEAISWKVPEDVFCDPPVERHTMHVQSWSHWAPANIGPYSQAVKIGELIYLAGQIGLIPGNLQLVEGGITYQCRLALRNVERLLKALDTNLNLRNVVQGICYVRNISSINQVRKLWEESTNNAIVDYVVVSDLPKSALVEWHVWAHRFNHLFEYEETGRIIDDKNWSISIFRRWNHENNIAAIVCHLEKTDIVQESIFNKDIFIECLNYTLQKLKQGHQSNCVPVLSLKIFYPMSKNVDASEYFTYFDDLKKEVFLTYTFVPVLHCKNQNTYLSICGTRTE